MHKHFPDKHEKKTTEERVREKKKEDWRRKSNALHRVFSFSEYKSMAMAIEMVKRYLFQCTQHHICSAYISITLCYNGHALKRPLQMSSRDWECDALNWDRCWISLSLSLFQLFLFFLMFFVYMFIGYFDK